ncbi:MAG: hypothetical protein ACLTZY_07810 [Alistipes indistinctus]
MAQKTIPSGARRLAKTDYRNLMRRRIRRVLLICSSYDAYTLEEDGRLEVQLNHEYMELNLSNPPSFTRVSSSTEALELLQGENDFDLVISMFNVGDLDVFHLSKQLKALHPEIPFVLLTNFSKDIYRRIEGEDRSAIDYIFSWHGNADLILAIVKLIEDRMNADDDILGVGVQSILLVEDSIRYYSTYLPAIYKLVLQQSAEFLKEALNEQQQMLRKRGRPKILLATNYEEAVMLYEHYKRNLLGVISDVGFVLHKNDPADSEKLDAGIDLCRLIKSDDPHMPFLLQSSQESMRKTAEELGVGFVVKYSKTLLIELSDYISEEFAFGDFVFQRSRQRRGDRPCAQTCAICSGSCRRFPKRCCSITPPATGCRSGCMPAGFFSAGGYVQIRFTRAISSDAWTDARVHRQSDSPNTASCRGTAWSRVSTAQTYNRYIWFARIGDGSLGGKARGLAFINSMLQTLPTSTTNTRESK